jgi:DNA replicative helicase MCM subunit Mcm2 (Cdc46/Mcm family)
MEELENAVKEKLTEVELEESIDHLTKAGDIFKPRKGFVQRL